MPRLPALKPKMVIRALKRNGFGIDHTTGSHYVMMKEKIRVVVPYHNRDLKPGTLASIIAQASLTVEEFVDLL
ncbi:MAG: type II toxin-antitoxin system HicA family toxin [Pyrinomonadaceae bacterium]